MTDPAARRRTAPNTSRCGKAASNRGHRSKSSPWRPGSWPTWRGSRFRSTLRLLKRQTTAPKEVSSLMLFAVASTKRLSHRRLRYFLLLSLRLLWLVLFSFSPSPIPSSIATQRPSQAIGWCCSSYQQFLQACVPELAWPTPRTQPSAYWLERVAPPAPSGRVRLAVAADDATDRGPVGLCAPPCRQFSPATAANFGELARAVRAVAESIHTPVELHLFSDMQRAISPPPSPTWRCPPTSRCTHAVVAKHQPNWTVESVTAPGQVSGKDEARPRTSRRLGHRTPAQRTVSLVVNGRPPRPRRRCSCQRTGQR